MLRLKRTIGACVLATIFFSIVETHAATYYVATTGNNSNPGTSSMPWRTVAYAAAKMVAGDTTYVKGGTYKEGLIRFGRSGTQSAPIKLLNEPGKWSVIDFIDKASTKKILLQNLAGAQKAIGWITIEGFEIRNGYDGIKIYNGHDITIRRNWMHHNLLNGIFGNGTRMLIDRNRINHNGRFSSCSTCNQDHGIYMNGTAVTIINNLIYDNQGTGVQMNGSVTYKSATHAGPEFALSRNWVIANNTIAYQVNGSGIVVWGAECDNARIDNNILYENRVKGVSHNVSGIAFTSASGSTGILIRNNLAYASGSGGTVFLGPGGRYTQSGNIVNATNPGFVYAPTAPVSSPNFALTSQSKAINKGLTTTARIAFNAVARPQGSAYDVGAYEYYTGGTTAQLLIAPTSATAF